jgi:LuxR family maltose regulon positive regulatory protein
VGRSRFRYHHLLTDLLRLELRRSAPATIASLHRIAAQWYEEHGHVVDAIRHAQSARDWPYAARLLADSAVDLIFDGRKATVRTLLAAFPADAPETDAELALAFATGRLYDGLFEESAAHIAVAERLAATVSGGRRRLFDIRLASARLWLACQRGDVDAARQARESFDAHAAATRADVSDYRASALMNLGIAELWSLHLDDARRDLEEALALARTIGRPYLEIGCLGHLALVADMTGSAVPLGVQQSEEALAIAEAHGWRTDRILAPAIAAGSVALTWLGRFDEAERWLDRVERAQESVEEFETEPIVHHAHGFVLVGLGRFREALAEFRAAGRTQPLLARAHALPADVRGWILIAQVLAGELTAASTAIAALDAEEGDRAGVCIAAASLALAEGRAQDAVDVLAPVIAHLLELPVEGSPQVLNPRWATVHALLLDAAARDQLGDPLAAEASIERALELAEPDGIVLPFALAPVHELLERHPRHRTAHATLVSTILDALAGSPPRTGAGKTALPEELSDAELRVVRFLPSNLKAPEIACELFVSANTVRTHLRHIYAKLDAHSRGEAVARAREVGLLGPSPQLR